MRIILSPAKKMNVNTDGLPWKDLPTFLSRTEMLVSILQGMSYEELKKLWKCKRLADMELHTRLTPAILSYEGIAYQYMAPGVFTDWEYDYVQEHLRILSGFYGILKPFDGVTPYRLEMQAKLKVSGRKDLYEYWDGSLAEHILAETDCIINLASKEYSICISKYLPKNVKFITCVFGEEKDGKVIEKGTMCKMARGEMVRFMAENHITDPEQIKTFDRLEYQYDENRSDETQFVFLRRAAL